MRLVVASIADEEAGELVALWSAPTRLLTPADLSHAGWWHDDACPDRARGWAERASFAAAGVSGLLIRLSRVWPQELTHIAVADREYVAGEMTAFLAAFLSGLRCPKLNRPTGANLLGPPWGPEVWRRIAGKIDIPVAINGRSTEVVTVIGGTAIGGSDQTRRTRAALLASATGVAQLTAYFVGDRLLTAEPVSDLRDPAVVTAMDNYLNGTA